MWNGRLRHHGCLRGRKVDWLHILAMTLGIKMGIVKVHNTQIWPKLVEMALGFDAGVETD